MNEQVIINKLVLAKDVLNSEKGIDKKYGKDIRKKIASEQTLCFEHILKLRQLLDHSPYPYNFALRRNGLDEVNASALSRGLYLLKKNYKNSQVHNRVQVFLNRNKDIVLYFKQQNLYKMSYTKLRYVLKHELSKYIRKFSKQHKYRYYLEYSEQLMHDFQHGRTDSEIQR